MTLHYTGFWVWIDIQQVIVSSEQMLSTYLCRLSLAMDLRSSMELCDGASINKLPAWPISRWMTRAWYMMDPAPALLMWPRQHIRLFLFILTKLELVVTGRASVATERPVILASIALLVPLILQIVLTSRFQVSNPYVSKEQTASSYNRNLTFWEMWGESNTWCSFPHAPRHCHCPPCTYIVAL